MQIQFATRVSCGNEVKHGPYSTGTVRALYGYCTDLYGGVQFFVSEVLGLDSVVGNLVPVGRFFKTSGPIFPCHTIFTRVAHGIYTGLHGFFLGGRTGGNIQRFPRLGRVGQEKPVKSAAFVAKDGGQVEEIVTS